jgi:hypothetical protein
MAAIKTINFLPSVFRSDTNQKFLNATLDQLVTPPDLQKVNGYVGRVFAPTFKPSDNYQPEPSKIRANYQLEPSVVVKDSAGAVNFFSSYIDLIQQIKHEGGLVDDHSRLFSSESYSFDGLFDYDKFVNFNQYYWLPDGPEIVDVFGANIDTERTFTVTRDPVTGTYNFSGYGTLDNPTLKLAHGGVYTFIVDQPGFPFWIQSYPGVDGLRPRQKNISTRSVLGVENNGTDQGTITFRVPQPIAQDYYTRMPLVATVDFGCDIGYKNIQNKLLSQIISQYGGIDGVSSQLLNKTLIFTHQEIDDSQWTLDNVTVPLAQRRSVWRINLIDNGSGDFVIDLQPSTQVSNNQKSYVKSGILNAEVNFYLDPDSLTYLPVPDITAPASKLYYQDGVTASMVGSMDMVAVNNSLINVDEEIVGKTNYTSPNGVVFTNGLKVRFDTSATPNTYDSNVYYVEGVGTGIRLIPVDSLQVPETYDVGLTTPDYITIKRDSLDLNSWSRSNRWFHYDVIKASAEYNTTLLTIDQNKRAKRPIIEFDADLQLFNYGRVAKVPVDILYETAIDAFEEIELESTFTLDGVDLVDGMRVIFANDVDPNVKNNIYVINVESINGSATIHLVLADDYDVQPFNTLVVKSGTNAGDTFYYDGIDWIQAQAKTSINQSPLFDVVDVNAYSISDATLYPASTFVGTEIFNYRPGTGSDDPVLGFPLSYRNFNQIGDIEFINKFDTDTFNYTGSTGVPVNQFLLRKNLNLTDYTPKNIWVKNAEPSKQFQIISAVYTGVSSYFEIDIAPEISGQTPYLRVYKNSQILDETQYVQGTVGVKSYISITDPTLAVNDQIDILIYSQQVSSLGYYEIPRNLDFNTENKNFDRLTLGQMRNHLTTMVGNSNRVVGQVPGASNLRDITIKQQGGSIVQHASPILYSELFLVDSDVNFIKGLDLARHEYSNFKNKFLELALTTPDLNLSDPVSATDTLLKKINAVKSRSFPWYYSDMVPYGDVKNVIEYNIINAQIRGYELSSIFDDSSLSNLAVLVYINNRQLIKGVDYTFDTTRAGFTISSDYLLEAGDSLRIVEYTNTDGNYVPETPSKLGLYPKFVPSIYLDDTYTTPVNVIQGHDGSITPAFGDFRDDLLLEFEKRIYNNIKVNYQENIFNLYDYLPGKFRTQDYTYAEFNKILSGSFLRWAGQNRVDFTTNSYFQAGNPWTWNYRRFRDSVDGSPLTGTWRSIFKYFYDTDRPHTHPWEMLGFSEQPDWWETRYGPAPYTGGNLVLWTDLEQGYIHAGPRAGYDTRFARPVLTRYIPVDEYGALRSPEKFLVSGYNSNDTNASYAIGDQGPVETAWRRSSEYPFAVQRALALSHPAYYFGTLMNVVRYYKNTSIDQYVLSDNLSRITPAQIDINGDTRTANTVVRTAGYLNWVVDYLKNNGIDPVTKISGYMENVSVQLAYKMAGYSDQKMLQVIAEQSSPTSTNSGVIVPAENYNLTLYKSTPVNKLVYSAVIVEKTDNGYTVSGYNLDDPYFTIIPSIANNNAYPINVNNEIGVVYNDYQKYKITVPYGFEFSNKQQVVDFLVSYERYLRGAGFVFSELDRDFELQKDFKLSIREFLAWSQQGWKTNNLIVLSPVLNNLVIGLNQGTVDGIVNSPNSSRILDTGFNFVKFNQMTVTRTENRFTLNVNQGQTIALAVLDVVEYEHVLIFDNTTVFNDIIYKPELGNRQYRLQLVGNKTGSWTGILNPPGFIYNNPNIDVWEPGVDYSKGSLVTFKTLFYAALDDIVATTEFNFNDWRQIPSDQIKSGLLPNFSYNAQRFNNIFDIDNPEPTMGMEDFSQGMIGFSPRQYMTDFGIDKTTQAKFYQGFIKEKGTINAINAFTAAGFNGVTSTISLYEEWAMRTGEYGAIENNRFVELQLVEETFTGDPVTFTLLPNNGTSTDRIIGIEPDQLYRAAPGYAPEIYNNRDDSSIYEDDLPIAGYVDEDHVDTTIFNIGNYTSLNSVLADVGVGYKIWCAKDFSDDWNVYRVYETNAVITSMTYSVDNVVTFNTKKPVDFSYGDLIVIKGFDVRFDGFYQIISINSATSFNILMSGTYLDQIKGVQNVSGLAPLYKLLSVRLKDSTNIADITPLRNWKDGDKLWADQTVNGTWAVYNKSTPWTEANVASNSMQLLANTYVSNGGFGEVVAISSDSTFAAAGMPYVMNGNVIAFVSNVSNGNVLTQVANIGVTTSGVSNFGSALDIKGNLLYVSAPGNGTTQYGRVYIYTFNGNSTFTLSQTLTSPVTSNVGDLYGYGISASADNAWLFVGAPNKANVYVYHANVSNYYTYANTITVGSNANVAFGSVIKTTSDASQTIIAAPYERVAGVNTAGLVYVYDRSMEKFIASGSNVFTTLHPAVSSTVKITVNGNVLTSGYTVFGNTTVILSTTPVVGSEVVIETSKIQQMEQVSALTKTSGAGFGTSADISGNDADIYVSSPGYSEPGYHSGLVYRYVNAGERYGLVNGTVINPMVSVGDSMFINGQLVTFGANAVGSPYGNITSITANINSASIVGITASITSDSTLLLTSNLTSSVDRLVITPGNTGNVLANLGITVYTAVQTIRHLPNDEINGFGKRLVVNPSGNSLIVSGPGSTTYNYLTIDSDTTLIDQGSTTFLDPILAAGAVYVYGLVESALSGGELDQMAFVQRLQNARLTAYDNFGSSLASSYNTMLVGAPGDDSATTLIDSVPTSIGDTGTIYTYTNPTGNVGWDVIVSEQPKVDIDSITRMYLFDTVTNSILTNLDHIDPAKGKLLGQAEQDIDFWTVYDPAVYNAAGATEYLTNDVSVNTEYPWGIEQVGMTWWNLDLVKFKNYEQGSLLHRIANWGETFPGSQIQIAEWVVSDTLPGQYTGDGTPLYPDSNSAFVVDTYVDVATKTVRTRYFFWVINKNSVDTRTTPRKNSIVALENMILNPQDQGIPYAAVIRSDTISLYNVSDYISSNTTVLHADYDFVKNENIIHSEYQLVQEGNYQSAIPDRVVNALRDSLAGRDQYDRPVPDPTLAIQSRIGIERGQTLFVDRIAAVKNWVSYVNAVLATTPVVNDFIIDSLYSAEAQPLPEEYDLLLDSYEKLAYINATQINAGYVVLVETDETQQGLWALYTFTGTVDSSGAPVFDLTRTQEYYTPFYWSKIDWYDPTYDFTVKPTFQVATKNDISPIIPLLYSGNTIKVLNNGKGQWEVYRYDDTLIETTVGIQNGTIELNSNLYDGSPNSQYEIRIIFDTLQNSIFKEGLAGKFNEMFFYMINYILGEQKTVDWIFKTSFVSIVHQLRKLEQFPNYIRDNQTYYESYINEVKPYRTSLREYLVDYQGNDTYEHNITDFDLPSTYDSTLGKYRSPDLTMDTDIATVSTNPLYTDWYNNYGYGLRSVSVVNAGVDSELPIVTLGLFNAAATISSGDFITQPSTGANGMAYINSIDSVIQLRDVTGTFTNVIETLTMESNVSVTAGDVLVQLSTGAYANVFATSTGNTVVVKDVSGNFDYDFYSNIGGNTYVYLNGANLSANVTVVTIDNAYIFKNSANLQVNVDVINYYTIETGGYYEQPRVTVVGGGGSGAVVEAVLDPVTNTIAGFEVIKPGSGYTSTPTIDINGTGSGALAYANLIGEYYIESVPTTVLTLSSNVTVYQGNVIFQPNTAVDGTVYTDAINSNVITLINTTGAFTTSNLIYTAEANLNSSVTGINSFTQFLDRGYNKVRSFSSNLKFDRISYTTSVVDWTANGAPIKSGTVVRYGSQAYTALKNAYEIVTLTSPVTIPAGNILTQANLTTIRLTANTTLTAGNVISQPSTGANGIVYSSSTSTSAILYNTYGTFDANLNLDANNYFYIDGANSLSRVTGLTSTFNTVEVYEDATASNTVKVWANTIVDTFNTTGNTYVYDGGTPEDPLFGNLSSRYVSTTTANSYVYSVATMKLNGNISANIGDYITQANTGANATVVASITNGNVITVSNLTYNFEPRNGNLSINGVPTTVRPATVNNIFDYTQYTFISADEFDNANDRIWAYYNPTADMPSRNLETLIGGLAYPGVKVQGVKFNEISSNITSNVISYSHSNLRLFSSNVSQFDFTDQNYAVGEYIKVANLDLSPEANLTFKIASVNNDYLLLSEISGTFSTITNGSNVAIKYYDNNDPVNLDSSIQSAYLDTELGTRPEDINVDGGAYYDTFSSHAPEELIPGQVFDHLNMRVYTKILGNTQILAYRIVANATSNVYTSDSRYWPQYYKIANASVLTANLNLTDSAISVANASVFSSPSVTLNTPGVIYINGEKIVYWRNYATETKTAWTANTVIGVDSLITYSGNTYLTSGNVYAANFANVSANVTLVDNNTLAQIRRGADKTGAPVVHVAGSAVEETSAYLMLPETGTGDLSSHKQTWLTTIDEAVARTLETDTGETIVTELGEELITSSTVDKFDGTGFEGSTEPQVVFLKG